MSDLTESQRVTDLSVLPGIQQRKHSNLPRQRYYLSVPQNSETRDVIVLVHGISRRAKLLIESFWPMIQGQGIALVAPLFDEKRCKDYQRLGRSGKGPRSDLALIAILSEVAELTGWSKRKALFYGHSAGAQFVQRFMFAHPQWVKRAAISAAGWYTFPEHHYFPLGIDSTRLLPGIHFAPNRFLRVPTAVFIGMQDTSRDDALNQRKKIDRLQGTNRLERARNWVSAMRNASHQSGLQPCVELFEFEGVGHNYRQAIEGGQINQRVLMWLLEARQD